MALIEFLSVRINEDGRDVSMSRLIACRSTGDCAEGVISGSTVLSG
jgi:hypothetical protein